MASNVRFYSFPSCSTCRKALAWLKENKVDYELIDIVQTPPGRETLAGAIEQLGDRKYLINTSGKSYRSIGSAVIKSMNESDFLDALCADGKLIKRPILITHSGAILVGFKIDAWHELLLN